jgi:O-antigen/teichoic acid export membrane protein
MEATQPQQNAGRVAKNTTYLTVALIGHKVLSFLHVLILARLVGVSSTGDYFSSVSFIALFTVFIDLGLTTTLIRQTARDQQQGETDLRHIVAFKMISSVVVAAIMLWIIQALVDAGRFQTNISYLRMAAIIMVMDSFVVTLYGFLRGIERLEFESVGIIIHRVAIMLFGIIGLMLGAPPIMTMYALLAASVSNFAFVTFQLWKRSVQWWPTWNWLAIRRLIITAAPFAVATLFSALFSTSDNILLQIYSGPHEVGLYATGSKIITAFTQIFPVALTAAVFPAMSAAFIRDREKLGSIFKDAVTYLLIVSVPLTVVISLLAKQIILLGWGPFWVDVAIPLRILALAIPFVFLYYPVGYLLNATNKQTRNTINICIAVTLNIIANLIFIKEYSYLSVAIISASTSAFLLLLGLLQIRNIIPIPWKYFMSVAGKCIIAGAALASVTWKLLPYAHGRSPSTVIIGVSMMLLYALFMMVLGLVRPRHFRAVLQRIRRS